MKLKTGLGYVVAVEVQCPECFEFVSGKNGSHLLTATTDSGLASGQVVECDGCGLMFRLPMLLAKVDGARAH